MGGYASTIVATAADRHIIVGKISGVYGLRGWLKVLSYTRPKENILGYSPWFLEGDGGRRKFAVDAGRVQGKRLLANLAGVVDREIAQALVDADVAVARRQLPALEAGHYYWCDLIGLGVVNRQNIVLGKVVDMTETGAHDVLIIKGDKQWLIPYIRGVYIIDVDLQQGRIIVDWEINATD